MRCNLEGFLNLQILYRVDPLMSDWHCALDMLFDAGLFNSEEEEEPARDTGDVVSWIDSGGKLLTAGPV